MPSHAQLVDHYPYASSTTKEVLVNPQSMRAGGIS
jgi:hypothetical protein